MDQMGVDHTMANLGDPSIEDEMMGDGLDEIINQNNQEMQRRRTMETGFGTNGSLNSHNRRASMMEFNAGNDSSLADFGFDPAPAPSGFQDTSNPMHVVQKASNLRKARSKEDLTMNNTFHPYGPVFDTFPDTSAYSSPAHASTSMNMPSNNFLPNNVDLAVDFNDPNASMSPLKYSSSTQQPIFAQSPLHATFPPSSYMTPTASMGGMDAPSDEQTIMEKVAQMSMPGALSGGKAATDSIKPSSNPASGGQTPIQSVKMDPSASSFSLLDQVQGSPNPYHSGGDMAQQAWTNGLVKQNLQKGLPSENLPVMKNDLPMTTQFPNAYSASGFDMLGVLMRVAGRRKPEINIGPVDMSCAFVVCDITQHDLPIVYCSDVFERLTGYSKHEILGRNCRFLQAPDGKVQAGIKRKYVDDKSVLHLKNKIATREEVQLSLINYRKGGQPFMNLLTMIPVQWDNEEYRYYVGFQVDLVEQPGSVAGRNPDGSYTINYQRGQLPRYIAQTPENQANQVEFGQTIGRDEVSTVLSTIASGESDLSKRIWDKVLLENTDDVVHVLSLKGLFLYLSPACRKVLEYDASELVGTALSSVCHPSDIVPVTRELKDTSSGSPINVVFRIRRKHSGYTWFESHGSLHIEQGKGRKCIILVGRERPVYALTRPGLEIGDSEVWAKISTSGMILFVASNVRLLLDRTPEDLIGTSIQALMRPESRLELGRALEQARAGKRTSFKHDLQNRRGQVLQAQTFLFPGDAEEGSKPTFLVAQTKLMKLSRMNLAQRPQVAASPRTDQASAGSMTPAGSSVAGSLSRAPSTTMTSSTHAGSGANGKGIITSSGGEALTIGNQDEILASEDNIFDELKTTRSTSWQFELRQMEKQNRILAEELQGLISRKKKRKRRKGAGQLEKDCANCHTRVTPEWRRGPSGNRDLCNSCGLRWAKQNGRVSPRKSASDSGRTPSHPSQASDQINKDNANPGQQHQQAGSKVPHSQNSPLPSGNREQATTIATGSNQNQQTKIPNNQSSQPSTIPTASTVAPELDSHIAKTARFVDQNLSGSLADRHSLPMKIDEDIEPDDTLDVDFGDIG